jgi:transketolase
MTEMAPREAFGQALAELGTKYDFNVLDGDLSKATRSIVFKEKFPTRHFNIGIAEGNLMGVAAGMASTGKRVVAAPLPCLPPGVPSSRCATQSPTRRST